MKWKLRENLQNKVNQKGKRQTKLTAAGLALAFLLQNVHLQIIQTSVSIFCFCFFCFFKFPIMCEINPQPPLPLGIL